MKYLSFTAFFVALSLGAETSGGTGSVLHIDDVIESVRKRYPPLLAALADQEVADGEVISAEGRFDTVFRTRIDFDEVGYYDNRRGDVWMEQPLSWQGMSLSSGYRVGDGEFAPYDGKLATRSLGEVRTLVQMPLLRNREIDSRRGELAKARIGRRLAHLSVEQQKLAVLQSAITRYWNWVAAGGRLRITREVLSVAEARQTLLEEAVRAGQLPGIEATDNRRAILQRRSALIDAERAFQQSSIELSLFYRDSVGKPVVAGVDQVPVQWRDMPPPVGDAAVDEMAALKRRPELARMEAQAEQNDVEVRMARNAAKPAIDLFAGFFSQGGSGTAVQRGPQEFKAGVSFDFSLQNRSARGKYVAADAKARQFGVRIGFVRDQIRAEVQDTMLAVRAAHERTRLLREEVQISRELEEAERTRFELGEGTLFILNQREQATMDAAIREAVAQADYQRTLGAYEYATGALLDR
jgi:cobalt-zinc-cadmium efflux system outer membrane protein